MFEQKEIEECIEWLENYYKNNVQDIETKNAKAK